MKYIMVETSDGQKLPFVFSENLVHSEFAKAALQSVRDHRRVACRVVSAGFVGFTAESVGVTCIGESESLGCLKSNPLDALRIMAGTSIEHMPDMMLRSMAAKLGMKL